MRVLAVLFLALLSSDVYARCYFLECEPGDAPGQGLPQTAPSRPAPKSATSLPRPNVDGEVSITRNGERYHVSSVLPPQLGFMYGPEKLIDNRLDTAWVPSNGNNGIGEWIIVEFNGMQAISGIKLLNGYHKSKSLYQKNNRVIDLEIRTSTGKRLNTTLDDSPAPQLLSFADIEKIEWVQLIIKSVYRGTYYRDTAITELRIVRDAN